MTINKDYDIKPIAAAVVLQAVNDAREGDQEAKAWLLGDGLIWLDVCGITYTPAQLRQRLRQRSRPYRKRRNQASAAELLRDNAY